MILQVPQAYCFENTIHFERYKTWEFTSDLLHGLCLEREQERSPVHVRKTKNYSHSCSLCLKVPLTLMSNETFPLVLFNVLLFSSISVIHR